MPQAIIKQKQTFMWWGCLSLAERPHTWAICVWCSNEWAYNHRDLEIKSLKCATTKNITNKSSIQCLTSFSQITAKQAPGKPGLRRGILRSSVMGALIRPRIVLAGCNCYTPLDKIVWCVRSIAFLCAKQVIFRDGLYAGLCSLGT